MLHKSMYCGQSYIFNLDVNFRKTGKPLSRYFPLLSSTELIFPEGVGRGFVLFGSTPLTPDAVFPAPNSSFTPYPSLGSAQNHLQVYNWEFHGLDLLLPAF